MPRVFRERREVMFRCVKCDVALCADRSCFEDYHTKTNFWDIISSILRTNRWSLGHNVSKRTCIFTSLFRNLSSPLCNKELIKFLRHSDQCLFPSPQNAFCFTNLSRLVLEILRFFEKHAQNLNTLQNNSASWHLHLAFNLAFKGLRPGLILDEFS